MSTPLDSTDWAPAACTLPTSDQPLRVAEFDALFAAASAGSTDGHPELALTLAPAPGRDDKVRELTHRESACCSFFTFRRRARRHGCACTSRSRRHSRTSSTPSPSGRSASRRSGMTTAQRTGQLADAVGVNIETLRYYERRGLLPSPTGRRRTSALLLRDRDDAPRDQSSPAARLHPRRGSRDSSRSDGTVTRRSAHGCTSGRCRSWPTSRPRSPTSKSSGTRSEPRSTPAATTSRPAPPTTTARCPSTNPGRVEQPLRDRRGRPPAVSD